MAVGETLRVRWRVRPGETPKISHHCRRCDRKSLFVCTEKFRANAQKKRLDVWLIYRCQRCGQTWNRPVYERRPVADIDRATLQAIAENDPGFARRIANDPRNGGRVEASGALDVIKQRDGGSPPSPDVVIITLEVEGACDQRLERLLARELGLSRRAVRQLFDRKVLTLSPPGRNALRRAVRDGQRVRIDLFRLEESRAAAILAKL